MIRPIRSISSPTALAGARAPEARAVRSVSAGVLTHVLLALVVAGCTSPESARPGAGSPATPTAPEAASATSEVVTYENLHAHEAYWPYHVEMTEDWTPEGATGERLGWGIGVLVRVESEGDLRVDFGQFGKYRVPARVTNVIDEANRIRLGERAKSEPNFVLAAINKLLDPESDPIRYLKPNDVREIRAYAIVAVDPMVDGFEEIAEAVRPLHGRTDVMPVLLPQGRHRDDVVLKRCKEVGWTDPVAHSRYAEAFKRSILGEDVALPSVMLQSPEGRVLYTSAWTEGTGRAVAAVVEDELGAAPEPVAKRLP